LTQKPQEVDQSIKRIIYYSLVSNKNLSKILPSSCLGPKCLGSDEVDLLNLLRDWTVL